MRRLLLLAVLASCGVAQAQGVEGTLKISDYRGAPLACGGSYTTDTWLAGKVTASGSGTSTFRVDAYYGDAGEAGHKFDRIGWNDVEVNGGRVVGVAYWWPQPDDVGEPYDWRFVFRVDGVIVSDCTVTVTRS